MEWGGGETGAISTELNTYELFLFVFPTRFCFYVRQNTGFSDNVYLMRKAFARPGCSLLTGHNADRN